MPEKSSFFNDLQGYESELLKKEKRIRELRENLHRLGREPIHDPRSGLFSTPFFYVQIQQEILRSERYRHFLSIVLIHFEEDDAHPCGSIQRFVKTFSPDFTQRVVRRTDIPTRFRTRQLAVIMPETNRSGAETAAERFDGCLPSDGPETQWGIVTYPADATNVEMVLRRVEALSEKLFRGKNGAGPRN